MKKKILSLVAALLMLAGTGFQAMACIGVTLSCGVKFDICNFEGTTTQLINSVLHMNNSVCGTSFEMLSD
ncbi:MAG TPA: hypothetical protein VLH37_01620 [Bacteroidales bacterium]|nr:hypothetical protein [Bacteroidales bacterium]